MERKKRAGVRSGKNGNPFLRTCPERLVVSEVAPSRRGRKGRDTEFGYAKTALMISGLFFVCLEIGYKNCYRERVRK